MRDDASVQAVAVSPPSWKNDDFYPGGQPSASPRQSTSRAGPFSRHERAGQAGGAVVIVDDPQIGLPRDWPAGGRLRELRVAPDASRHGVRVRVERRGAYARLSVSDTGIGIAPKGAPHVFERSTASNVLATSRGCSSPRTPSTLFMRGSQDGPAPAPDRGPLSRGYTARTVQSYVLTTLRLAPPRADRHLRTRAPVHLD